MSNNSAETSKNVTPAVSDSPVKKLVEEGMLIQGKKTLPNQTTAETKTEGDVSDLPVVEPENDEEPKKSLKDRVAALRVKCGEKRKVLLAVAAAGAVTAVTYAIYLKNQATEVIELDDEESEGSTDENAS